MVLYEDLTLNFVMLINPLNVQLNVPNYNFKFVFVFS